MKICHWCKETIRETAKYCDQCGEAVDNNRKRRDSFRIAEKEYCPKCGGVGSIVPQREINDWEPRNARDICDRCNGTRYVWETKDT